MGYILHTCSEKDVLKHDRQFDFWLVGSTIAHWVGDKTVPIVELIGIFCLESSTSLILLWFNVLPKRFVVVPSTMPRSAVSMTNATVIVTALRPTVLGRNGQMGGA